MCLLVGDDDHPTVPVVVRPRGHTVGGAPMPIARPITQGPTISVIL
jgi:hypothetical protein